MVLSVLTPLAGVLRRGRRRPGLRMRKVVGHATLQCAEMVRGLQPGQYFIVRHPPSGMTWGYRAAAVEADTITVEGRLGFELADGEMRFSDASQLVLSGGIEVVLHAESRP